MIVSIHMFIVVIMIATANNGYYYYCLLLLYIACAILPTASCAFGVCDGECRRQTAPGCDARRQLHLGGLEETTVAARSCCIRMHIHGFSLRHFC